MFGDAVADVDVEEDPEPDAVRLAVDAPLVIPSLAESLCETRPFTSPFVPFPFSVARFVVLLVPTSRSMESEGRGVGRFMSATAAIHGTLVVAVSLVTSCTLQHRATGEAFVSLESVGDVGDDARGKMVVRYSEATGTVVNL